MEVGAEPANCSPRMDISVPNVCSALHVFALLRLTSTVGAVSVPPMFIVLFGEVKDVRPPPAPGMFCQEPRWYQRHAPVEILK